MNIQISDQVTKITIITLGNRIDSANSRALRHSFAEMVDRGERNFVLNLTNVIFMDSAGLAVLVSLLKTARTHNGDVKMIPPVHQAALRILQLTKFDRLFEMVDSPQAALDTF